MNYYHIYNRGAHKENIFRCRKDMIRFLDGLVFFNDAESKNRKMSDTSINNRRIPRGLTCLVTVHAYCLLPNHFHLLITCEDPKHVSKFMQKLGTGYAAYFNETYREHSGTIFQGTYKKVCVESEAQLYQVLAYINGNGYIHRVEDNRYISSINEYFDSQHSIISPHNLVSSEFSSRESFHSFCAERNHATLQKRSEDKQGLLID